MKGLMADQIAGKPMSLKTQINRLSETDEQRFDRLARQWKAETKYLSSVHALSMHPAYQQIIGMGMGVVPFILRELEQSPNHWFWALSSITGEDPISAEEKGELPSMTLAWLRWGRDRG